MKDSGGKVIYVGKAAELRKRVRSYFRKTDASPKIAVLVKNIADVDWVETKTEVEALLLEAYLVDKYKPRYNTRLKDDKSYPLLAVTREKFPRVFVTRDRGMKNVKYYGPYTDARLLREAVRLIHEIFPVRKCVKLPKEACLYYHLKQCLAPCVQGAEITEEYARLVEEITGILKGGKKTLVEYLYEKMEDASENLRFEEAQRFKEQIQAVSKLKRKRFFSGRPEAAFTLAASLELKGVLKLRRLPERIVCFDVSNISGREAVASKVAFLHELPFKMAYRRYRIRTVSGIDDYAMIAEALGRMLKGLKSGKEEFVPDLVIIDGGRGHLGVALKTLKEEGFAEMPVISIAKRLEEIFTPRSAKPLRLEEDSPVLHLIQKIRDEAHRFAVSYHRLLRTKGLSRSALDAIKGIGAKRKEALLRRFGSVEALGRASEEEIARIPGIGKAAARAVKRKLRDRTRFPSR